MFPTAKVIWCQTSGGYGWPWGSPGGKVINADCTLAITKDRRFKSKGKLFEHGDLMCDYPRAGPDLWRNQRQSPGNRYRAFVRLHLCTFMLLLLVCSHHSDSQHFISHLQYMGKKKHDRGSYTKALQLRGVKKKEWLIMYMVRNVFFIEKSRVYSSA